MFKSLIAFCCIAIIFSSCKTSNASKPDAVGQLGTLAIVTSKETHSGLSSLLTSMLQKEDLQLPGGQPFSELLRPDQDEFFKFFFNQKSILVLVTDDNRKQLSDVLEPFSKEEVKGLVNSPSPDLITKNDVFARFQKVVYLFGKNDDDLKRKLAICQKQLIAVLLGNEIQSQYDMLYSQPSANDKFFKEIKDELGLGFKVPADFKLKEHVNGFWWFEFESKEGSSSKTIALLAHAYNYNDTSDFSYSGIRTHRDSVIKYHIKGEIKGTYMGTSESDAYPPRFVKQTVINKLSGTRVSGWWNIEGLIMSGPFTRYVFRVPNSNRLFAFEGFIYKPNLNTKENDLRLIESIALSIN